MGNVVLADIDIDGMMELNDSKNAITDEVRIKAFVDEFSKSCPMLDYQKKLLIRAIVNVCHNYLSYDLEMKKLGRLYCRDMTRILCELLSFDKGRNNEENKI